MKRRLFTIIGVLALSLVLVAPAAAAPPDNPQPGKPDFSPHIYADGEAWGTKIGPLLPPPNGKNNQSFDLLFLVIDDGQEIQLPVGEAAPGNPQYNGGRWWVHTATWQVEPHATFTFYEVKDVYDLGTPQDPGTDWENLAAHVELGHLVIEDVEFYFLCPLLPVK